MFDEEMGNCFVKKKDGTAISYENTHHFSSHIPSSPSHSSRPRFSSLRLVSHLCVSYPSSRPLRLVSHLVFDIATRRPRLIHLISYRCHLATSKTPTSVNADKNELNKTARPHQLRSPLTAEPIGTRETRRLTPPTPPTSHTSRHPPRKRHDKTGRDEQRPEEQNETQYGGTTRDANDIERPNEIHDETIRKDETKRKTRNATTRRCYKTHRRDDERDERRDEEREEKQDEKTKRRHEKHNETPHIY